MQLLNSDFTYSYRVNTTAKQLPNFSNYIILPNEGLIWSKKRGKFIGYEDSKGYYGITLTDDNGRVTKGKLHRFIWQAVNGPIPEGMEVNHIDEDKTNNSIINLNLMTHKENMNFGTRTERATKKTAKILTNGVTSKPVGAFLNRELKFSFPSIAEASRNGFNQGNITSCCQGKLKTYKGYEWRYLEN